MDAIFKNSENSKASEPHRLLINLAGKTNLKGSDKCAALSNLSMYLVCTTHGKIENIHTKTISAPTRNEKFDVPDGSCSISDV